MQILLILFLVIVVLDIVAWKWGVDSRSRTKYRECKDEWVGEQREPIRA